MLLDVLGDVVLLDVPGDVVLLLVLPGAVELVLESVELLEDVLDEVLEPLGDVALEVPGVASGREALGEVGEAAPAVAVSVAGAAPVELVCA